MAAAAFATVAGCAAGGPPGRSDAGPGTAGPPAGSRETIGGAPAVTGPAEATATRAAATAAHRGGADSGASPGRVPDAPARGRVLAGLPPAGPAPGQVVLAFAGDVHFEGVAARALNGDLGTAGRLLARADVAVVNLETAVTDRGTAQPKKYTFRAPPRAMGALRTAGVDAVSVANNHGMDFGPVGFADTLAAGRRHRMPIVGGGANVSAAFAPYRTTVRGVRVSVLAATDVLDDFALRTWTATGSRPGLASAKDTARLVAAVRAAARGADVVAVVLHWGVERVVCPTARQVRLARALTAAGADVVVGSHAHVVQPRVRSGRAAVHYGMGNFVWYASGGAGAQTGVYTVTVRQDGAVVADSWAPAQIRSGRPMLLSGSAAAAARTTLGAQARRCGIR